MMKHHRFVSRKQFLQGKKERKEKRKHIAQTHIKKSNTAI